MSFTTDKPPLTPKQMEEKFEMIFRINECKPKSFSDLGLNLTLDLFGVRNFQEFFLLLLKYKLEELIEIEMIEYERDYSGIKCALFSKKLRNEMDSHFNGKDLNKAITFCAMNYLPSKERRRFLFMRSHSGIDAFEVDWEQSPTSILDFKHKFDIDQTIASGKLMGSKHCCLSWAFRRSGPKNAVAVVPAPAVSTARKNPCSFFASQGSCFTRDNKVGPSQLPD